MNTTLKEIIYNLKNLKQAGRQSQDQLLQDSQYAFIVDYYRGILIGREANAGREISSFNYQTIEYPFIRVKNVKDDIFADKRVYKADLPSFVQSNNKPLISIRASMFSPAISRSSSSTIRWDLYSPTTGELERWFPEGKTAFIVTPKPIENLFVTAVFDHPLDIEKYKFDKGQTSQFNPFDPYNFEYPMSQKHLDGLYKMVLDGEIRFSLTTRNDITADGIEDPLASSLPKSTQQNEG